MIEYHYADLLRQFTEEFDKIRTRELQEQREKFDKLYAREQKNYKRYETALQRCRELLGKAMPMLSGEVFEEAKLFQGILADMLHDKIDKSWLDTVAEFEQSPFYKDWLEKRERK